MTCTGTLIDPAGSAAGDAKAWLLTAGHCFSLEAYGVIRNQPFNAEVIFHYFADTPDRRLSIRTRSIGWSTMKGVDVGLIELDATLGELRARGVNPLRIAAATPDAGRLRVRIGTHLIDTVTVAPHSGIAGMDDIRFNLPRDFPLHLFQLVSVETADGGSNFHWIYLD